MGMNSFLNTGLNKLFINGNGILVNLINYSIEGNDYDDILTQTNIGSSFISGLEFPMHSKQGSSEALLLDQGKLLMTDKIVYIGSTALSSSGLLIGLGNPPIAYYTIVENGITTYRTNGSVVYNKLYLRQTIPGSIF